MRQTLPLNERGIRHPLQIYGIWLLLLCGLFYRVFPVMALDANGPIIGAITTNLSDYPHEQVPVYEKLELTFAVATVAENFQFPYDASPPPGIEAEIGVTVDAHFSPDNWQTVYTQPAFYYQDFVYEVRSGQDWLYPTDDYAWKVRFAPHQVGEWQYKLVAQDRGGITETLPQTFTVVASSNKGFVRVSQTDPRYFEFENGDLFLGLGYNLTFGQLDWNNFITVNESRLQTLQANGLQLFRTWLTQWGIFTSAWGAWNSPLPERHALYIPDPSLSMDYAYPGSEVSMVLTWNTNPGMFLGFLKNSPAVKRNTTYQVTIRYLLPHPLQGPRIAGHPYGLVAKTGGWLAGSDPWPDNIAGFVDPGTGTIVSDYAFASPTDGDGEPQWAILAGTLTTGDEDFLPYFYLVLENIEAGTPPSSGNNAYIDRVEIREDFGNGQYGPNIVTKPWMAQHFYFEQRNSFAFDQVLALARHYDIYLKLVILEKNVWGLNVINDDGDYLNDPLCWDEEPNNDPPECPGNRWFYGNHREMTKVRWLQQAWWRYLQARWGYSPHIHSWELLNEGDPFEGRHYTLADEFGRYMHQFRPNDHLVTTSFWNSFPKDEFWANAAYPNIDYADLHHYDEPPDMAENSQYFSRHFGAKQPDGAAKPLIRGETGVDHHGINQDILQDTAGVWLHNFIWAGVNSGGMYEQYWYSPDHIEQTDHGNDLRYHYKPYYTFMSGIPLHNGHYEDAQAVVSNNALRAWGQKDVVHGQAHLWLQNTHHIWRNVVDNVPMPAISSTLVISGFLPGVDYRVEWWDPYQADQAQQIMITDTVTAHIDGTLTISVTDLATDIALKVQDARPYPIINDRLHIPLIVR